MADLELIRKAINFAMKELCDGYLDMPSGCDGCPLCDFDNLDDDGNVDCVGKCSVSLLSCMDWMVQTMAELIDREALKAALIERGFYPAIVKSALEKAPTVDAVEVVRCLDCEVPHNKYTGCPNLNGLVTPHDFYCPFGEQKEGSD